MLKQNYQNTLTFIKNKKKMNKSEIEACNVTFILGFGFPLFYFFADVELHKMNE